MFQQVILLGRLGDDPELRHTTSGAAVASLRLATNEWIRTRDGEGNDHTEWHTVVAWGNAAEYAAKYGRKGWLCWVEGVLRTEDYIDPAGIKRRITKVRAGRLKLLGPPRGTGDRPAPTPAPALADELPPDGPPMGDDDIPF